MNGHTQSKFTQKFITVSIATLFTFAASHAHANWWEKGADLLKQAEQSDTVKQVTQALGEKTTAQVKDFSKQELEQAFRQALKIGSETVVQNLSQTDAFNKDSNIHIPLPSSFKSVQKTLGRFGADGMLNDLETKLNRAAESATPKAKQLFINAIQNLTFEDVQAIYRGDQDAATQFLKRTTSDDLKKEMTPIISDSLNQVGAVQAYDKVIAQYKKYPFVPDVKNNLQEHVLDKALQGIFYYVAKEEADIRENPAKRTTDLLKKVFAN